MAATRSLATRAIRGFLWTGSASLVQVVVIMIVYRQLPTGAMGTFEWSLTLVMLVALLGDLGLGPALVQMQRAGEEHFYTAFWTNLGWGVLLTALLLGSLTWSAHLLGGAQPAEFRRIFALLCLLIPSASVSGIFRARLQRALDFPAVALAEIVSVLAYGIFTLSLLARYGVLAVAAGSVVREFALLASLCRSARWRPRFRFDPAGLRQLLSFALHFTGARIVGFLNTYIASFVIFPLLGRTSMGYYRLAERLTLQPLTRLATTVNRVSFPTFSTIQEDDDLLRRGYLRSVQSLVLLMGPLLVGLFFFAPALLRLLDKEPALMVLRLLAAAALLKVMGTMVGSIFMAKGKANWSFYWSIFSLGVLLPSMYLSVPHGVEGIAGAIAGTSLLFLILSQALANRLIGLSFSAYLRALVRPGLVLLALSVFLAAARVSLPLSSPTGLGAAALLGGAAYLAGLRLFAWELFREFWRRFHG